MAEDADAQFEYAVRYELLTGAKAVVGYGGTLESSRGLLKRMREDGYSCEVVKRLVTPWKEV